MFDGNNINKTNPREFEEEEGVDDMEEEGEGSEEDGTAYKEKKVNWFHGSVFWAVMLLAVVIGFFVYSYYSNQNLVEEIVEQPEITEEAPGIVLHELTQQEFDGIINQIIFEDEDGNATSITSYLNGRINYIESELNKLKEQL